jgi:hypothetical protein
MRDPYLSAIIDFVENGGDPWGSPLLCTPEQ